jgi:hypothetical protein
LQASTDHAEATAKLEEEWKRREGQLSDEVEELRRQMSDRSVETSVLEMSLEQESIL